MKIISRLFVLLLFIVIVGPVVATVMMVEDQPLVTSSQSQQLSVTDIRRARVFIDNSDPRNLAPGEISAFVVDQADLELLLNYGLENLRGGAATVTLGDGLADLVLSARLPDNPLGSYFNLQLSLSQLGDTLAIERLKVGGLTVPRWLADSSMHAVHGQLQQRIPEYAAAIDAINGYSLSPSQLNVVYQWQPDLVEQISNRGRELLVSADTQERLLAHATNLVSVSNDPGLGRVVSLGSLIGPMFSFAQARGGNPVEENRAAVMVMAMYIMGISVPRVLGLPADTLAPSGKHRLTLSQRTDFAQHFLVSAGLAVSTGTVLADSIGVLKELEDSQGGSGFSFTDIGADRTGVRFAELATASPAAALAMQAQLAADSSEQLFMAEFRDLPEFMQEDEFIRRFGGEGQSAYNSMIDEIENRISATALFSNMNGG